MDALSALSIAATVTQFVSFAGGLIAQTSEVHESARASTAEVQSVETVYGTLLEFSFGLKNAGRDLAELDCSLDARKLLELVAECQADCERLLAITRKLKAEGKEKTWYQCLCKAVESTWKWPEIKLLDERLQRTQLTLVLLICSISRSEAPFSHESDGGEKSRWTIPQELKKAV